ncbi:MAG: ABC transporter ATP-binding protein [Actinobacteria bacterium]|nr:ABC transporter ATP-binding protein [Actinomycetota bacterium]
MGGGPMGFGPRGGHFPIHGEKPKNFRQTMKKFLKYIGEFKVSIIVVIVFAVLSTVFAIIGPKIIGKATTKLFEGVISQISGAGTGIDFEYIGSIIILAVGLYVFSAVFSYVQGWIMSGVSMRITYRLRKDISEKINRLPLKYFDSTNQGEVLSRVTNDVDTINQTLNQSLTQIIMSVTSVLGVLIMMFTISWIMTLAALLIIPLSFIMLMTVIKRSQKFFKQQQDFLGHVNGHVEEMFGGHNVVKAFNAEMKSAEKFDSYNNILYLAAWKSQFFSGMMMPITFFIGNLGYVAVTVLGGWLAIQGKLAVGDILAFILYVRSFMQPISQMANISNILQQTAAAAERVFDFLEEGEEIPETDNPVRLEHVAGSVEFKNVHFGYKKGKIVIRNFSAAVRPGQKIAIVGPTGAGKTTMVKLLMRFYDVNSGEILIDGRNIKDFFRSDLRSIFGMVLQDTWLYNATILENIRYGRQDATDEEAVESAKIAYVDHFVHALPNGYHMELNEETTNISQGQKQLITIARAVLADPKILILDEATSSVDTRTELHIQSAMDNLMKDRTSFIIAHRLSTIRNADLILVMDNGDIVEQGKHTELIEKNGFYASLYYSQFENSSQ